MMTNANNTEMNNQDQSRSSAHPDLTKKAIFTTTLYAQPYSMDAVGFYFHTFEEFETQSENLRDRFGNPVEEFEIQFIDGDDAELFEACCINQANLSMWFDDIEDMDDHEKIALYFLTGTLGYNLDQAMDKVEDVIIFEGDAKEAAEELFDECYAHTIPENLRFYFDMDKFARDLEIGGDFNEFDFNGTTYTCTNASGI
jgi:hypothetical protein